ncbi:hypothetical protein AVEN_217129-1 [Araneus ventricosus]|uniref:Uncharacterized protein n=1 Tax=Araneus ventricosus TaxID=182803 RepID=A0A4Y2E5Y1_ARAVE|nr:hypothetical protein AVEN_217129-1 [Araneus ventricosus]
MILALLSNVHFKGKKLLKAAAKFSGQKLPSNFIGNLQNSIKPDDSIEILFLKRSHPHSITPTNFLKMAAPASRIIKPFMPSFFHLALVKISVPLYNEFDIKTLERVFIDIQNGNSAKFNKGSQNNRKANRAKEKLLFIPAHLRRGVLEAVMGLHWAVYRWQSEHSSILNLKDGECIFYWRPDGTIDRIKTAEQLVLNENINIRERFDIACIYCLKESVQTLWEEMEASCETQNFEADCNFMTRFWVRWMREGSGVPWLQAVKESPDLALALQTAQPPRCSSFFPLLGPKDRKIFLSSLKWAHYDDFRFCLYAATTEEEGKILKKGALTLLSLYLDWPLQSWFLETAEKVWHFLDKSSFYVSLMFIWSLYKERKDFDYSKLFVDFWNNSPNNLREIVKKCPIMSKRIDSCLNKIKRKKQFSSDTDRKKWIRENGRLESIPWTS